MKNVDVNYFPGWVRKSVSFTIDDGNLVWDKKFIDIVKTGGIKGTFNLCNFHFDKLSPEGYRELYRGYEIANHVRMHPFALKDGVSYEIKEGPHPETGENSTDLYPHEREEGVYYVTAPRGWRLMATTDAYVRLTLEATAQINEVFGQKALGFVWPYHKQENKELFERIKKMGFYAIRSTGETSDTTGFEIPKDRTNWSYNANNVSLLKNAKLYRDYPDDGSLKTFIFGVHAIDFERSGNWCDLEAFAEEYGGRPDEFWYATNYEIFSYQDAVRAVVIKDDEIENPSDIAVYIKIDGAPTVLEPHAKIKL